MTNPRWILYAGDTLAIVIIVLIGFATHGETNLSFLPRMAALFFPLIIAWFLLAHHFQLFQAEVTSSPKHLWRPALVMLFAVPLAAVLRGFSLNAPIIPIFVLVLCGTSALGMILWRALYYLFNYNRAK